MKKFLFKLSYYFIMAAVAFALSRLFKTDLTRCIAMIALYGAVDCQVQLWEKK